MVSQPGERRNFLRIVSEITADQLRRAPGFFVIIDVIWVDDNYHLIKKIENFLGLRLFYAD